MKNSKYLILEVHPAFAIALEYNGRVIKVANMDLHVGDRLDFVIELNYEERIPFFKRKLFKIYSYFLSIFTTIIFLWQMLLYPVGAVRISINPSFEMTINRINHVISLKPLNEDGKEFIQGVKYRMKDADSVTKELILKAEHDGYLNGKKTIEVEALSKNKNWKDSAEKHLLSTISSASPDDIKITILVPSEADDENINLSRRADNFADDDDIDDDIDDDDDSDDDDSDDDDSDDDDSDDDDSDDDDSDDDDSDDDDLDDDDSDDDDSDDDDLDDDDLDDDDLDDDDLDDDDLDDDDLDDDDLDDDDSDDDDSDDDDSDDDDSDDDDLDDDDSDDDNSDDDDSDDDDSDDDDSDDDNSDDDSDDDD